MRIELEGNKDLILSFFFGNLPSLRCQSSKKEKFNKLNFLFTNIRNFNNLFNLKKKSITLIIQTSSTYEDKYNFNSFFHNLPI